MTYRVIAKWGWFYVVGEPEPKDKDAGPWRYNWEAQEYADSLNARHAYGETARCAECDCKNPPDGCNWIKSATT